MRGRHRVCREKGTLGSGARFVDSVTNNERGLGLWKKLVKPGELFNDGVTRIWSRTRDLPWALDYFRFRAL